MSVHIIQTTHKNTEDTDDSISCHYCTVHGQGIKYRTVQKIMVAIKGAIRTPQQNNKLGDEMRMLFTLLLNVLTATSGEGTHATVRGRGTH